MQQESSFRRLPCLRKEEVASEDISQSTFHIPIHTSQSTSLHTNIPARAVARACEISMLPAPLFRLVCLSSWLCVILSKSAWINVARHDVVTWKEMDTQKEKEFAIQLQVNHLSAYCVFDRIRIAWEFDTNESKFSQLNSNIHLVHSTLDNPDRSVAIPLGSLLPRALSLQEPSLIYKIRCADTSDSLCQPIAKSITLLQDVNIIAVVFDRNTTMPTVPLDALHEAIHITPPTLQPTRVQWLSASSAHIHLDASDMTNIIQTFQTNSLQVKIAVAPIDFSLSIFQKGAKMLRLLRPSSQSRLYFADLETNRMMSNLVELAIKHCGDDEETEENESLMQTFFEASETSILAFPMRSLPSSSPFYKSVASPLPDIEFVSSSGHPTKQEINDYARAKRTQFAMHGIWAVRGKDSVQISSKAAPALSLGTWSLSFWIRLIEAPTGAFRALLYKGDITGVDSFQRTPSIWLRPDSNHLSLRFSTASFHDHSISSIQELPMNVWTHLVLTVENTSYIRSALKAQYYSAVNITKSSKLLDYNQKIEEMDNLDVDYKFRLYINGVLDVEGLMSIADPVIGNEHALQLFYDNTFTGPKSFVQGISVWDGVLSQESIITEYLRGVRGNHAVDVMLEIMTHAYSPLIPFVQQWHTFRGLSSEEQSKQSYIRSYLQEAFPRDLNMTDIVEEKAITVTMDGEGDAEVITPEKPSEISSSLHQFFAQKSQESITNCDTYEQRLDIHAESAELGTSRSLVHWSKLLMLGYEVSDSRCGYAAKVKDAHQAWSKHTSNSMTSTDSLFLATEKSKKELRKRQLPSLLRPLNSAAAGLTLAIDAGEISAIMPLTLLCLQGGLGMDQLLNALILTQDDEDGTGWFDSENWQIPWKMHRNAAQYKHRKPNFAKALWTFVYQRLRSYDHATGTSSSSQSDSFPFFADTWLRQTGRFGFADRNWSQNPKSTRMWRTLREIGIGLLFLGALHGDFEAQVALSYRYRNHLDGCLVQEAEFDGDETAAWYATQPVRHTAQYFQLMGAQAVIEAHRINDDTVRDLGTGNLGQDDELIEMQRIRAKEGDVGAMLGMGDLYYYGARGLPQDHAQAFQYFRQAAERGDAQGMCGVANMYLKGEGTPQNTSAAISWYEQATVLDSVRAYNGLGYMYFYGQHVPQNYTKALKYFVHAASYENDGDSLFNAAYCLEQGFGIDLYDDASAANTSVAMKRAAALQKAVYYYQVAARKLGHFGSIQTLGLMHMEGRGVDRSAVTAMQYFVPAMTIGPWASWMRRGFDLFLIAQDVSKTTGIAATLWKQTTSSLSSWSRYFALSSSASSAVYQDSANVMQETLWLHSLLCYLYIGELGQEVAQSNAAYILRTKLLSSSSTLSLLHRRQERQPQQEQQSALRASIRLSSTALTHTVTMQYLRTAEIHAQADAWLQLGNLFFPRSPFSLSLSSSSSSSSSSPSQGAGTPTVDSHDLTGASMPGHFSWTPGNELSSLEDVLRLPVSSLDGTGLGTSYARALYCYQRAVALSAHPIALMYLGVMHHFGLGLPTAQPLRAGRYYAWALSSSGNNNKDANGHGVQLTTQMQWIVASLQQTLAWSTPSVDADDDASSSSSSSSNTNSPVDASSSSLSSSPSSSSSSSSIHRKYAANTVLHGGLEYVVQLLWQ